MKKNNLVGILKKRNDRYISMIDNLYEKFKEKYPKITQNARMLRPVLLLIAKEDGKVSICPKDTDQFLALLFAASISGLTICVDAEGPIIEEGNEDVEIPLLVDLDRPLLEIEQQTYRQKELLEMPLEKLKALFK